LLLFTFLFLVPSTNLKHSPPDNLKQTSLPLLLILHVSEDFSSSFFAFAWHSALLPLTVQSAVVPSLSDVDEDSEEDAPLEALALALAYALPLVFV